MSGSPLQVAIIGSGIRGLADITLFEAGSHFGGHTHTVDIALPGPQGPVSHGVDTGFLVFNERTYPQLIALFAEVGVASARSDMSFNSQPTAGWRHIAITGMRLRNSMKNCRCWAA